MAVVVATDEEVSTPFVVRVAVVALAVEDAGPVEKKKTLCLKNFLVLLRRIVCLVPSP